MLKDVHYFSLSDSCVAFCSNSPRRLLGFLLLFFLDVMAILRGSVLDELSLLFGMFSSTFGIDCASLGRLSASDFILVCADYIFPTLKNSRKQRIRVITHKISREVDHTLQFISIEEVPSSVCKIKASSCTELHDHIFRRIGIRRYLTHRYIKRRTEGLC